MMNTSESQPGKPAARSGAVTKAAIVVALALAVGAAVYMRSQRLLPAAPATAASTMQPEAAPAAAGTAQGPESPRLPRLVDLGADKCIPCKMMAPILDELKKAHAGRFDVEFIDVWKNPGAARAYGVDVIPTQVFFDAEGRERFRHQGFYAKEDILAKWKELGVAVDAAGASPAPAD